MEVQRRQCKQNSQNGYEVCTFKKIKNVHQLLIINPKRYIYIYIYTRFQKGFHIERYIDRYILLISCTCARVHLHLLLSNL